MPLDSLLREQAAQGLFGPVEDTEAEVARRAGVLRTGESAGVPQPGPDAEALILRGLPITEGGFMLLLNGVTHWQPAPAQPVSMGMEQAEPEAMTIPAAVVEW